MKQWNDKAEYLGEAVISYYRQNYQGSCLYPEPSVIAAVGVKVPHIREGSLIIKPRAWIGGSWFCCYSTEHRGLDHKKLLLPYVNSPSTYTLYSLYMS